MMNKFRNRFQRRPAKDGEFQLSLYDGSRGGERESRPTRRGNNIGDIERREMSYEPRMSFGNGSRQPSEPSFSQQEILRRRSKGSSRGSRSSRPMKERRAEAVYAPSSRSMGSQGRRSCDTPRERNRHPRYFEGSQPTQDYDDYSGWSRQQLETYTEDEYGHLAHDYYADNYDHQPQMGAPVHDYQGRAYYEERAGMETYYERDAYSYERKYAAPSRGRGDILVRLESEDQSVPVSSNYKRQQPGPAEADWIGGTNAYEDNPSRRSAASSSNWILPDASTISTKGSLLPQHKQPINLPKGYVWRKDGTILTEESSIDPALKNDRYNHGELAAQSLMQDLESRGYRVDPRLGILPGGSVSTAGSERYKVDRGILNKESLGAAGPEKPLSFPRNDTTEQKFSGNNVFRMKNGDDTEAPFGNERCDDRSGTSRKSKDRSQGSRSLFRAKTKTVPGSKYSEPVSSKAKVVDAMPTNPHARRKPDASGDVDSISLSKRRSGAVGSRESPTMPNIKPGADGDPSRNSPLISPQSCPNGRPGTRDDGASTGSSKLKSNVGGSRSSPNSGGMKQGENDGQSRTSPPNHPRPLTPPISHSDIRLGTKDDGGSTTSSKLRAKATSSRTELIKPENKREENDGGGSTTSSKQRMKLKKSNSSVPSLDRYGPDNLKSTQLDDTELDEGEDTQGTSTHGTSTQGNSTQDEDSTERDTQSGTKQSSLIELNPLPKQPASFATDHVPRLNFFGHRRVGFSGEYPPVTSAGDRVPEVVDPGTDNTTDVSLLSVPKSNISTVSSLSFQGQTPENSVERMFEQMFLACRLGLFQPNRT